MAEQEQIQPTQPVAGAPFWTGAPQASASPGITPVAPVVPAAPAAPAAAPAAPAEGVALIGIDDFFKTKLVTGEVLSAANHPKADRLLILQVKVGDRTKQIVSGIRLFYSAEQMVGKTIIVVDNLMPVKLRGEDSQGMLLAVSLPEGGLRLVTTDGPAASGLTVK